ncbi:MAG: hypothetical protein GY768_13970 [Planctomycetaceae bacterium]|nr:hypothetical protein [Planctomycetaceae bacterium]
MAQGALLDIAQIVASPRLVLPFVYMAVGAPAIFAGLLIPIVQISRTAGQLASASSISSARNRKWHMAAGIFAVAASLTVASLAAIAGTPKIVGGIFLLISATIGLGQGVSRLAFQSLLGNILEENRRGALLFTQTALSGLLAIIVVWITHSSGLIDVAPKDHVALIWAGVFVTIISGAFSLAIKEHAVIDATDESEDESEETEQIFTGITQGILLIRQQRWFRQFLVARALFLSIELAMPFYTIHASIVYKNKPNALSFFVIASSLGLVIGGPLWSLFSRKSLRGIMCAGAVMTAISGAIAVSTSIAPNLQQLMIYAPVFLLLSIADQGLSTARKLYLVNSVPEKERPYYLAMSDGIISIMAIWFALAIGILAHSQREILPIVALMVINVAAACASLLLPAPDKIKEIGTLQH